MEKISAAVAWRLADRLRGGSDPKQQQSGTATFSRMDDDGTAWIRIPGNDFDTPVEGGMYADAQEGDAVPYSIAGGQVAVTGNVTSPSVGQRVVDATIAPVRAAVSRATESIVMVRSIADAAKRVADAIDQHFWTDTNGIHVTELTQDDWQSRQSGANVLINSIGQLFRDGLRNLLVLLPAQTETITLTGDGTTTRFQMGVVPSKIRSVTIDGVETTSYRWDWLTSNEIIFDTAPSNGSEISIVYNTNNTSIAMFDGNGNDDENVFASFGEGGMRIGYNEDNHIAMNSNAIEFIDGEQNNYFSVYDLRTMGGPEGHYIDLTDRFRGDGSTLTFNLTSIADDTDYEVLCVPAHTSSINKSRTQFTFVTAPPRGTEVLAIYTSSDPSTKVYNIGFRIRESGSMSVASGYRTTASAFASFSEGEGSVASGPWSHAAGNGSTASGPMSHAEGGGTTASGSESHAEGSGTVASGDCSHAEGGTNVASGVSSHAEGAETTASGDTSHAEGWQTTASAQSAHAQNLGTVAGYAYQTAIGKFNDNQQGSAFEIGNGTNASSRSNALTVDWDGNVDAAGGAELQDSVTVYSPTIEDNTTYSSNVGGNGLEMRNGSGTFVGQIRAYARSGADRLRGLQIGGFNEASTAYNYLYLMVDKDGNRVVQVSEVAPWYDMLRITPSDTAMTINTTNTTSIGNNNVRRSGKVVTVQFTELKITAALANATTSPVLATIPSGYRPSWNVYSAAIRTANIGSSYWRIDSSGNLTLRNQSGASIAAAATFAGTITYIIA